ncbi:MAG: hypothetical protein LBH03_03610 [Holophagales bacterium]|nr:hypothetical protein [Holophagales bacterium]
MKIHYLLCVCTVFSIAGFAQEPPQSGQFTGQMRIQQSYDVSKEETINAKVLDVKEQARGPMTLVTLSIELDGKECQVTVGPAEFLKEKDAAFAKDDEITITGVQNETPQGLRIRAREIKNGDKTLTLIDSEGRSIWRPQGQGEAGRTPPPQ